MSEHDQYSEYGFFVRDGLKGALFHRFETDPSTAVRSLLRTGCSVQDGGHIWVWRADRVRIDLYDTTQPARRPSAFGPVGDPIVFEVTIQLRELPQVCAENPKAVHHVLTEYGALCGFMSGKAPINWPEGHIWCPAESVDGLISIGMNVCEGCRDKVTQVGQDDTEAESVVHVLLDGASLCGLKATGLPSGDSGCSLREAQQLATCRPCVSHARHRTRAKVTQSGQTDT